MPSLLLIILVAHLTAALGTLACLADSWLCAAVPARLHNSE